MPGPRRGRSTPAPKTRPQTSVTGASDESPFRRRTTACRNILPALFLLSVVQERGISRNLRVAADVRAARWKAGEMGEEEKKIGNRKRFPPPSRLRLSGTRGSA